jgi:hypothetical protein
MIGVFVWIVLSIKRVIARIALANKSG